MRHKLIWSALFTLSVAIGSCNDGGNDVAPQLPEGSNGWYIETQYLDNVLQGFGNVPHVTVLGSYVPGSASSTAVGSVDPFAIRTDKFGRGTLLNAISPAEWVLTWEGVDPATDPAWTTYNGCNGLSTQIEASPGNTEAVTCVRFSGGGFGPASAAPISFLPNPVVSNLSAVKLSWNNRC